VSVLYTLLDPAVILAGMDKEGPPYQEIEVGGVKLLVEQQTMDTCRIVRLISTNPRDYLNNELQPGTELKFVPQIEKSKEDYNSYI